MKLRAASMFDADMANKKGKSKAEVAGQLAYKLGWSAGPCRVIDNPDMGLRKDYQ